MKVALACEQCGGRNYHTKRKKHSTPRDRLALKKYCPTCGGHTLHKETK